MSNPEISDEFPAASGEFSVTVTERGPLLVYGRPPLAVQSIVCDGEHESRAFREGRRFSTEAQPTALCRCGASGRKPYCDGTHQRVSWDPMLTASDEPLRRDVERTEGGTLVLEDNAKYCVFARFCHPDGDTWSLTERSDDPGAREQAIRQASLCPSARLTTRDKASGKVYEFRFEPSLGLIEDEAVGASGGLWIRGGIPLRREDGRTYEIRNRVVVCRCGHSANKPYCDGTHVAVKWRDGLAGETASGERLRPEMQPEEVG